MYVYIYSYPWVWVDAVTSVGTDCTARIEVIRKSAELRERDRQPVILRAARQTERNGTDMRRNENF